MGENPYMKYENSSPFERQIIIAHKTRTSKTLHLYVHPCVRATLSKKGSARGLGNLNLYTRKEDYIYNNRKQTLRR